MNLCGLCLVCMVFCFDLCLLLLTLVDSVVLICYCAVLFGCLGLLLWGLGDCWWVVGCVVLCLLVVSD